MAATYTPVSLAEMVELLSPAKGWNEVTLDRVQEHVLDWRVHRFAETVVVRVYTSVRISDDAGRGCGKDAIRVCAVNLDTDRGLVKAKRVHRVENWRINLRKRIESVIAELDTRNFTLLSKTQRQARRDAEAQPIPAPIPVPPPPPVTPRVQAHEWEDAPANISGLFNEDGDLDEAAAVELLDEDEPVTRSQTFQAPPAHNVCTNGLTANRSKRKRRRPTLKARYQ